MAGVPNYANRDELTPTELQVLRYAGDGLTSRETAKKTGRSLETVKTHRQHAIRKLGAKTIGHAFAIAFRRGLVE